MEKACKEKHEGDIGIQGRQAPYYCNIVLPTSAAKHQVLEKWLQVTQAQKQEA